VFIANLANDGQYTVTELPEFFRVAGSFATSASRDALLERLYCYYAPTHSYKKKRAEVKTSANGRLVTGM